MDKETVFAFIGGTLFGAICAAVWTSNRYKRELNAFCDEYDGYLDELQNKWDKHCEDCQYNHDVVEDDDIDDAEAQALVEQLNMMASLDDEESETEEEDEDDEDPYPDFEHDTYASTVQKLKDENGVVDYTSFSQKKNKTEDEATAEDDNKEAERVQDEYLEEGEGDELVIRFIDESEYGDDEDYDQVELTYLEGSDVFLTEDDVKYDAYSQIGGKQNLKDGLEESGTGVVYIRNTSLEIDFRIVSDIRDYDTYMEETSSN